MAAKIALDVFCTTRTPNLSEDRQEEYNARQEILDTASVTTIELNKKQSVVGYHLSCSGKAKGKVIILHGWFSSANFMVDIAGRVLDQGYDAILVDFPGHGRARGKRLDIFQAARAVTALERALGPFDHIVAHSFGGFVSSILISSLNDPEPITVKSCIIMAAPSRMSKALRRFMLRLGLTESAQRLLLERAKKMAGYPVADYDTRHQFSQTNIPIHLLHDPKDKEVYFEESEYASSAGKHVVLHPIDGVGHRRILSDKASLDVISKLIAAT